MKLGVLESLYRARFLSAKVRAGVQDRIDHPEEMKPMAVEGMAYRLKRLKPMGFDTTTFQRFIGQAAREWVARNEWSLTGISDLVQTLRNEGLEEEIPDLLEEFRAAARRLGQNIERVDVDDILPLYHKMNRDEDIGVVAVPEFMQAAEALPWFETALRVYSTVPMDERANEEDEELMAQYPRVAYWYATETLAGDTRHTPKLIKDAICEDPVLAARYADALKSDERHWKEGGRVEQLIAQSAEASVIYADVYMMRFRAGEPAIMADPHWKKVYEGKIASREIEEDQYIGEDGY